MILKWQSSYTSNNFTNNLYTLHISDVFRRIFGELCKKVIQKDLGNFHEMMEKWQIMRGKVLGCERLPNCIVKTCKILFTLLIGHTLSNLQHAILHDWLLTAALPWRCFLPFPILSTFHPLRQEGKIPRKFDTQHP